LFAPTDAAFTALPDGNLKSKLTADPVDANHNALLQDVLKFHVISGATAIMTANLPATPTDVDTLSAGNPLTLKANAPEIKADDVEATVSIADVTATNGVVHVVNKVLFPASCSRTVVGIATGSADHMTLVALLTASDLITTLSIDTVGTGYTVFAPTNTAFAKIDTATLTCLRLPANKVHLVNLLKYHVVGSTVVAGSLTDGEEITSLDTTSDRYRFASNGTTLTPLDGTAAKITTTDLLATNGLVHVIDTVLIPKGFVAKLFCSTQSAGEAGGGSDMLPAIIGDVAGLAVLLGIAFFVYRYRRNAHKKQEEPNATTAAVSDLASITVELDTSLDNEPQAEENVQPDKFQLLFAGAKNMTSADLELPGSEKLKKAMFDGTFLAEATSATLNGILATGKHCPVIGAIFSILKDLKNECSKYVESSQECKRLSVWCVGLIGTIGRLAENVTIDTETAGLLNAAVPALLAMQELVDKRLKNMRSGLVGKAMAFFTSDDYMHLSNQAQKRVHLAIDCLSLRVQVDTRVAVEEVQQRCRMLPNMDKKLDSILTLTHENSNKLDQNSQKLDQMLKQTAKQGAKEKAAQLKESNMEDYNIPAHQMSVDASFISIFYLYVCICIF